MKDTIDIKKTFPRTEIQQKEKVQSPKREYKRAKNRDVIENEIEEFLEYYNKDPNLIIEQQ